MQIKPWKSELHRVVSGKLTHGSRLEGGVGL
jgi:hypothetical protein